VTSVQAGRTTDYRSGSIVYASRAQARLTMSVVIKISKTKWNLVAAIQVMKYAERSRVLQTVATTVRLLPIEDRGGPCRELLEGAEAVKRAKVNPTTSAHQASKPTYGPRRGQVFHKAAYEYGIGSAHINVK